ncbi:MAG: hypothetical protein ABSE08_13385 [Syntrophobacteraceae bacterium]|jgi:hypothetical protein
MGLDPVSLGVMSLVAGVAGAGMQGYSQYQAANYNAQVAANNQKIAQQNAGISLQQGTIAEENQRLKTGGMIAAIDTQQAASGIQTNSGSALNVRSSAAETGELDALTIRYNSQLAARNEMQAASNFGAQSSLYGAESEWAIGNSILGGASSVSDKWLKYQQTGVLGGGNAGDAAMSSVYYPWMN